MPNTINVVAAIVDTRQLTLYTDKGAKVYILQGDPRLARIVHEITPILSSRPGAVAWEISLNSDVIDPYREYEKQSGGLVRLFRVAKKALTSLFTDPEDVEADPVGSQIIGTVPVRDEAERRNQLMQSAVNQILTHASSVPASDPEFNDDGTGEHGSSTIVAVVGNQVIHNVEALKPQMQRAISLGSTKGMDAFMQRLASVASLRQHSAQDLLKFLEKGDLPIADDGSIVIYKVLRRRDGHYVDCHTGNVPQKVGSFVCMEANLVDADRRVECSNGLHVARRAYIHGFSGDVVVLAKVAPEDVIAVPVEDANKMRVCGYHILFELSDDSYRLLKFNRAFTDNGEAKALLGRALAGDHPAPIEMVKITAQYGGGVVVTPIAGTKKEKVSVVSTPAEALSDDSETAAPAVDPRAVSKQVAEVKAKSETRADIAQRLYQDWLSAKSVTETIGAADTLIDYKKRVKLGWSALGLPENLDKSLRA